MSKLEKIKAMLTSRTIIGALLLLITLIFPKFSGFITGDEIAHFFDQVFELIGFVLIFIGRIRAQGPLFQPPDSGQ
ncbi:MAG: hypothetical protein U0Z53_29125 [Blastocatellia bacterium]